MRQAGIGHARSLPVNCDSEFNRRIAATAARHHCPQVNFAVGFDYLELIGIEMLQGRSFSKNYGAAADHAFILYAMRIMTISLVSLFLVLESLAGDWPQYLGPNRNGFSPETGLNSNWSEKGPQILWQQALGTGCVGPMGTVYCINLVTHQPEWIRNFREDFGAELLVWAFSQSPLLYKDLLIAAPQYKEVGVVAYRKSSGEIAWQTPRLCEEPGYVWFHHLTLSRAPEIPKQVRNDTLLRTLLSC